MTTSKRHSAEYLQEISRKLFAAAGTPDDIAATIAQILVNANLAGHDSHGVQFVPMYLDRIEAGEIAQTAYPEIVRETVNTLHVDGHKGFGHYMSRQAMDWAIDRARTVNRLLRHIREHDSHRPPGRVRRAGRQSWLRYHDHIGLGFRRRFAGGPLRRRAGRAGNQSNCGRHSDRR